MPTQSGSRMVVNVLVLLVFTFVVQKTDGACSFPSDLRGTWQSSRWGDITFSATQVTVTLIDIGTVILECEIQSGTISILRSTTTVTVLGNTVDVVTCLDLRRQSSVKYMYHHATSEVVFISGGTEPVKLVSPSSTVTTTIACDVQKPYRAGSNHIMIEFGSEMSVGSQCPNPLLGAFDNYTIDNGAGAQCGGLGYFTACDDRQNVTVDYSICSERMFYSSGGNLQCVYYSVSGSTYFVNLYNFDTTVDDINTFRFSCVAIQYGSDSCDYVYATQYPRTCTENQTATYAPTGTYQDGTILMHPNVPSSSGSSGSSVGVIVAIIILLIIIILICLAFYHLWYRKRWAMVREKLPCFNGNNKSQVDPQMDDDDDDDDIKSSTITIDIVERPISGRHTAVVTTAVVTEDSLKRLRSTQSTRSVITPSKLQPEFVEGETAVDEFVTSSAINDLAGPLNPTPRRLPPLETARAGENQLFGVEPVYLAQQRVAPLETSRLSEESESSDAVSTPPHLPPIYEKEPLYQNM